MRHLKVIALSLSLVVLSALAYVGVASAQSFRSGNSVTVPTNETINSMLFAAGNNVDIAGKVNGDVYCAGQNITISGSVNGDVICAGQTITVSGSVSGSVRLGGQTINLGGSIGNSATIGAQSLVIEKNAKVERDLLGGSQSVTINGEIKRDVLIGSSSLIVNGRVGRDIKGGTENITVGSNGFVGGNVNYTGNNDPIISSGGKITGTVNRTAPERSQPASRYFTPFTFAISAFIYLLVTMIVMSLVLVGLFPHIFEEAAVTAIKRPGMTALVGLLALILVPFVLFLLFATVIGIPLAILMMLVWIVIMMLTGPFTGYLLGRLIMRHSIQYGWVMLFGISLLVISYFIPIIGFLTLLATVIIGTGMIIMQSRRLLPRFSKNHK